MLKSIVFIISATLLGYSWILYRILAHSAAPELSSIVAVTFLLGLIGVIYWIVSALLVIREWQKSRSRF